MILTVRNSLRSLYYRLIRLRLLSERSFGQLTLTDRLLHMRPLSGLVLSAPALLFIFWYSGLAISTHLRQRSAVKSDEPLTIELFHLHLHDRLVADLRRLTMPEPMTRSDLPTYNMVVSNDRLGQLDSHFPPDEGRGNYVEGLLENKNRIYEIEVRYRGTKHWHWNNPQKSWKVRVKPDHLMFEGLPTFNFVNTPDPMPFGEQMVLDVARDQGLLTPPYYPFRLQLNRAYLGVYFFEAQADEGLLRRARRMPGSIYSGAGAPVNADTQVSSLWEATKYWKKVGAIGDGAEHDVSELEGLLDKINRSTAKDFAAFAETALDVEKFATFDALDVVFGNNQHDYDQNHKLYFDPYKNRFEPIATDFRDLEHERVFNRTDNPLLLRLKQLPDYLSLRNRKIYELLNGVCSPKAISEQMRHWMELLAPDQARDPYWDAYELLPVMGTYYRQLVRPMNDERQALAARVRLQVHGTRADYLRQELEHLELSARLSAGAPLAPVASIGTVRSRPGRSHRQEGRAEPVTALDITVGGPGAFKWDEIAPEFSADCRPASWQLLSDRDLDQAFSTNSDLPILTVSSGTGNPNSTLYPGVILRQIATTANRGRVRAEVEPRRYRFFLQSGGCAAKRVTIRGQNTATLAPIELVVDRGDPEPATEPVSCEDRRGFIEPGSRSLHPACYPLHREETLHIGPGLVELKQTRVYSKYQTVVIEPGTTIRAAKNASLILYGRLMAEGRADARIRFVPEDTRWGGLALQGPATAGSRLEHVEFVAGTQPELGFFDFPGMVNIHDTADVHVSHAEFARNERSDDALHVAYVDGLKLSHLTFHDVNSDAVDLEYTTAKVTHIDVIGAGDDGLDLMGSHVELSGSRFIKCSGNGLSVGERSEVTATRSIVARSTRAILLKNASTMNASEMLSYHNAVGVRLEKESLWYVGTSKLQLDSVHTGQTALKFDGSQSTTTGELIDRLTESDLGELRRDVLQLGAWSRLDAALDRLEQRGLP